MGAFNQPSLSAAQGFPRPTMPAGQRTAQLDARAGEAIPSLTQIAFTVTTQPSLVLSLYAPRYCLTASAGFGRQFTKLRALSRLRRRYGSKKVPYPLVPLSPPHHQKNKR